MFEPVYSEKQLFGNGASLLLLGDVTKEPPELERFSGQVQCVYADPPFSTGKSFARARPFGQKGWSRKQKPLSYPAYSDALAEDYDAFLECLVTRAYKLLKNTGVFCLHLDWRKSAQARLLCDRIFGEENFINEIIWAYESGGRSTSHFSRKHDTILLYGKSRKYRFDISRVPVPRSTVRKNHMKRSMDEDGRFYSSIVTNGKEYRYYDDEPAYPGDVWTDISHLQQKDPERTGYATQKPLRLVERLFLPVTEPGDLVADLCCGSGTSLEAAQRVGCRFIGMDCSPEAVSLSLSRLEQKDLTVLCPTDPGKASLTGSWDPERGVTTLTAFEDFHPSFPEVTADPLDKVESWYAGWMLPDGTFLAGPPQSRSFRYPALGVTSRNSLKPDTGSAIPAVLVTDAASRRYTFAWRD